jgi:hypothetical protein
MGRWRAELVAGRFEACIRDPRTGEFLPLDKRGWACGPGLGPRPEIEDFVYPDDPWQPGPTTEIDGKLRPVFFVRDAFMAALLSNEDQMIEDWRPIPESEPNTRKQSAAWRAAKKAWPRTGGPPRNLSWQRVTEICNENRVKSEELLSEETIQRMFEYAPGKTGKTGKMTN